VRNFERESARSSAVTQIVCRALSIVKTFVRFQANLRTIFGVQSDICTCFFQSTFVYSWQYYLTNASYSFILLSSTLYSLMN
jgi:hypothetical protein